MLLMFRYSITGDTKDVKWYEQSISNWDSPCVSKADYTMNSDKYKQASTDMKNSDKIWAANKKKCEPPLPPPLALSLPPPVSGNPCVMKSRCARKSSAPCCVEHLLGAIIAADRQDASFFAALFA